MHTRFTALLFGLVTASLAPAAFAQNDPVGAVIGTAANAANGVLGNSPGQGPRTPSVPSIGGPSARVPAAVRRLPPNAPRQLIRVTADGYMNLPLETFNTVRRVTPPPFDWTANGCSFGEVSGPFRDSFNRACNRHEFGYRNYGGRGLALDRTEARRTRIDDRLRDDLNGICRSEHRGLTETPCLVAAQAVYGAARSAGRSWFNTGNGRPPSVPTPSVPGFNNGANNGPIPGVQIPMLNGQPVVLPGLQQRKRAKTVL